ncbi:hypothetical protein BN903_10 [Halorubrum sp. AJ67]|nr:hypothetical protein BN903_10 [Halorubrum sp. AJ67]
MSTSSLLLEVYIIILSHVTMVFTYFVSSGAEKWVLVKSFRIVCRYPRLRRNLLPAVEGGPPVPRAGLPNGNRRIELPDPSGRGPDRSLELLDGLEVAFRPHELGQPSRRVTRRTAEVGPEILKIGGIVLPLLATLWTDESDERVDHVPAYSGPR